MSPFEQTLALIDQANAQDPRPATHDGQSYPQELLYAQRMTERLQAFAPEASEHLQIAARGQHIERWTSARSDYPEGRTGYKKWRANLSLFHAHRVGELMAQAGYELDDIQRTRYLVQKRGLKRDSESQCLEDVICLVFIEHYLADFASKHPEDKLIDILRKIWGKMSEQGQQAALQLPLDSARQALLSKALSPA